MTTPDEFRYAKAHLHAAIDHLKLAQHYIGVPDRRVYAEARVENITDSALSHANRAYDEARELSLKPFAPLPEPYTCPQCGLDPNGDAIHTLTHHTIPGHTVEEAKAILRGDRPLKGV